MYEPGPLTLTSVIAYPIGARSWGLSSAAFGHGEV